MGFEVFTKVVFGGDCLKDLEVALKDSKACGCCWHVLER